MPVAHTEITWIDTAPGLREWLVRLADAPEVALDTESNGMHAYAERVCLVQVSVPKRSSDGAVQTRDAIIDPLAVDIEPLGAMLEDPRQQKILHGADFDVVSLKRDYGFSIANLFDTMIASRVLGWPRHGLASILGEHFGFRADKRYQRYDWGQRPLAAEAVEYARHDTKFLPALRELQCAQLVERDRLDLCLHACARQVRVEHRPRRFEPDDVWKIRGVLDLEPEGRAVARALFVHRDALARALDRPVFKVMGDRTLLALARRRPRDPRALLRVPGMGRLWSGRRGRELVRVIEEATDTEPPIPSPRDTTRPPPEVRERYEALRRWRKSHAEAQGFEPDVVLPRQTLWALAEAGPLSADALAGVDALDDWERERYAEPLLRVLRQASG